MPTRSGLASSEQSGRTLRISKGLLVSLRAHQWVKNVLLAAPAIAAHLHVTGPLLGLHVAGFVAFSLTASGTYIANDLIDRHRDRAHPTKSLRPIAAGTVPVPTALLGMLVLPTLGLVLASALPRGFVEALAAYLAGSVAYSCMLKREPLIDIMALAGLYSLRLLAGAALANVSLSGWFLAFFVFFLTALAATKRVGELERRGETQPAQIEGRGYYAADKALLIPLGTACAAASSLVYCLYITGPTVLPLYRHPDVLWAGLPLLLYWQARMLLLAARGGMPDDPVAFALRDPVSYGVFFLLATAVFLAV